MVSGERSVAGWILEERLGSGGYGEVWRARRRHVDIVRAVKLIPIVDDGAFESWRREIAPLEALDHPNVVRFYDADIVSEGTYGGYAWIATELCERSLAASLRAREGHTLPGPDGERLVADMLAALSAAHAAGLVHRDLKPANILQHRSGTWKLCDFGTARLIPSDATHPMTRVVGTSPYMSPAAHRGRQNQAADLYALGVTLHEALCGMRLHRRPEGMTDSELIKLVLDAPPSISPELPRRWRTVVAALIGEFGPLGAAQLGPWFAETRGDRPPPTAVVAHVPRIPPEAKTAPTAVAAASRPRSRGPVVVTGPMAPRVRHHRRRSGAAPGSNGSAGSKGSNGSNGSAGSNGSRPHGRTAATELRPIGAIAVPPTPTPKAPAPPVQVPRPPGPPVPVRPPAVARPPWTPPAPVPMVAGLGRRFVAALVDLVVVVVLAGALAIAAVVAAYDKLPAEGNSCGDLQDVYASCIDLGEDIYVSRNGPLPFAPFVLVTGLLVFVVLQGVSGWTPGKLLTGLRVVGPGGRRPGMPRAFLRTALWLVDGFPWVVPVLGWLVALCNRRRRRLGDLVAGTVVVRRHG